MPGGQHHTLVRDPQQSGDGCAVRYTMAHGCERDKSRRIFFEILEEFSALYDCIWQ